MRVLAVMSPSEGATFDQIKPLLTDEERLAWKFYKENFVRDFFMTDRVGTVVVIAEADSLNVVRKRFEELPLVAQNLLHYELFKLLPFTNWETLFESSFRNELQRSRTEKQS